MILFTGFYIITITDPMELLIEFLGLMVLVEIDNYSALIFELHLDNYYQETSHASKYLFFKTT
jgi:hypothetical protein